MVPRLRHSLFGKVSRSNKAENHTSILEAIREVGLKLAETIDEADGPLVPDRPDVSLSRLIFSEMTALILSRKAMSSHRVSISCWSIINPT